MSKVTAGHETESETGVCNSGESVSRFCLLHRQLILLSLAFDLGYHGDLTS